MTTKVRVLCIKRAHRLVAGLAFHESLACRISGYIKLVLY